MNTISSYCFCHSMIRQWCLSHSSLYYRLLTFNNSISISIDYLRVPEPAKVLLNLTNRFHVAVRLFSNRSQMTSKCGKNKKVAHEAQPSVSLMFLPHFDVLCDLWSMVYGQNVVRTKKWHTRRSRVCHRVCRCQ